MARVTANIGMDDYKVDVRAGHHTLVSDEPEKIGGRDAGPAPFQLLLAALGSCTAITLRMYAKRKDWPLESAEVAMRHLKDGETARIERVLTLSGNLTDEQRARLADIAERTPVTLAIKNGVAVETTLSGS
ncbi:OsmC family protein [Sphingosinicella xenopeptidilytica]|uniref:OsmC family protein n=1 Tax=Sphingosinicella xenopeptidilytica TaxID=364098 RepID=A0ABW3C8F6_SPHXN